VPEPRGPYARGRARREEIVATATRVIAEEGYRQTSLRRVADELGMQPSHLLHYVGSRHGLLEAVVTAWDARNHELAAPEDDYLTTWLAGTRRNLDVPGIVHLYTTFSAEAAAPDHPSHDFFVQRFRRLHAALTTELTRCRDEGRYVGPWDVATAATAVIALSDGLQLQWLVDREVDLVGTLQAAVDGLVRRG
jgi:AcrR family transcriptional regulator